MRCALPLVVAFAVTLSGPAWGQGARNPFLTQPGPGPGTPGAPPLIGGESAGITPGAMPPAIGNTAVEGGIAPGAPLGQNGAAPGAGNPALQPGANGFTRGQAQARIQKQGFTNVTGLHRDEHGIWHGKAMRNGHPASVSLDDHGDVAGSQGSAPGREAGRFNRGETR